MPRAEQQVTRLLADADARAVHERAAAGSQRRSDLEVEGAELRADAEAHAAALRQRAVNAFPDLIDRAVDLVRSFALERGAPTTPSGSDG